MDIIERIKKLYNLSTRNSSTQEAAAAAAKIQELCFKHELDLEKIIADGTDTTKKEAYERFDYMLPETCRTDLGWKRNLFGAICRANWCQPVQFPGTTKMAVVGQLHNYEVVVYMYEYLTREIQRLAVEYVIKQGFLANKDKRKYIQGFNEGAAIAVGNKLRESIRTQEAQTSDSRALVVLKGRELETAVKSVFPHLGSAGRRRPTGSSSGYSHGRQAGAGISLNRGVGTGSRKQIG